LSGPGVVSGPTRQATGAAPAGAYRLALGDRKRVLVAAPVIYLGLTSLLTDISSETVATILPLYLTVQLGLSPFAFGFVDGLYQGVTALVRIGRGFVADRTRRPKLVAACGYAASAIAKLPAAGVTAISSVIVFDRAGKGVRTAPRDALIAASSPGPSLGTAFGVHRALDTVGANARTTAGVQHAHGDPGRLRRDIRGQLQLRARWPGPCSSFSCPIYGRPARTGRWPSRVAPQPHS
jgi:hypothetical protein